MTQLSHKGERRAELIVDALRKWNSEISPDPGNCRPLTFVIAFLAGLERVSKEEVETAWEQAIENKEVN